MRVGYLGTATLLIELDGQRLLTDPAFDPKGTTYDFGPWYTPRSWFASAKLYTTPTEPNALGAIDAVLLSHDQHADNLDYAGRELLAGETVHRTITTVQAARRLAMPARPDSEGRTMPGGGLGLAGRVTGLAWGESTRVGNVTVTATPARHGPFGTPQIHEVMGFLLEPTSKSEPVVWISGDTVAFSALEAVIDEMKKRPRRVDIAVLHAGAVNFPKLPIVGKRLFTFDAAQLVAIAQRLGPKIVVPIHRDGWQHFRQPTSELREALASAGIATRWLELGETLET